MSAINAQLQQLEQVMRIDLSKFNQLVREQSIPAVIVKPQQGAGSEQPSEKKDEENEAPN